MIYVLVVNLSSLILVHIRPVSAVSLSHDGGTLFSVSHGKSHDCSLGLYIMGCTLTPTDTTLKVHTLAEGGQLLRSAAISHLVC